MQNCIIVVDDEETIRNMLSLFLSKEGYSVLEAENGTQALKLFFANKVDLIVLDVKLPDIDGFEVCKNIRAVSDVPILFLSAISDDDHQLLGYRLGADDYIQKPFKASILTLKVKQMLSRYYKQLNADFGADMNQGIYIDTDYHVCMVNGKKIELTPKEFQILLKLYKANGRVLTREQLLVSIWGYDCVVDDRVIDVYIRRLRKKLGPMADVIKTVITIGYKFEMSK